jgi:ankyrin repeat protein
MEQQITKYEKRMPDHVRAILDRSKKHSRPNLNEEQKWYALICATWYEDAVSVKSLLEDDALDEQALKYTYNDKKINIWSCARTFPRLHVLPLTVALYTQNQDIITLLRDKSDLEDDMCSIDALAAYMGDVDLLDQCILNNDFDSSYNDKLGGGLLQLAVRNGHEKMVERLLQLSDIKASINSWRFDGAPVLFIAAQRGFCNIAKQLCEAGANPAALYTHPYSMEKLLSIHIAAEKKHAAMVKLLCEQLDDLANKPDDYGNTALHIAAQNGDEKTVTVLLAVPTINVDIKNKSGERPVDVAKKGYTSHCENLLWRWMDKNKPRQ